MRSLNHLEIKEICRGSIEPIMEKYHLGVVKKVVMDTAGWVNPCFFINDAFVFRFNARDPLLPKYQREKFAFDLLKNSKVPVPQRVILDDSKSLAPYDVLITEMLEGRNLETEWPTLNAERKEALAVAAGETWKELSKATFPFFGELASSGPLPRKNSWASFLEAKLSYHLNECIVIGIFDPKEINMFESKLQDSLAALAQVTEAKLVHADFHFGNLLFKSESITGVVDFEWAFAGDPLYDFCRWHLGEEDWPGSRAAFIKGACVFNLSALEMKRIAIYQMIRNIELCAVAKLHFTPEEAKFFREQTLSQAMKL